MPRALRQSRGARFFVRAILILCLADIGFFAVFFQLADRMHRDFRPIKETFSAEHEAAIAGIPNYRRPEDATYLTFPEWYLVFNPQEYAEFLRTKRASQFPYLKSIHEFWRGYAEVYSVTHRNYPANFGDQLMVLVIGSSTTIEYLFKSAYENTAGRFFEWISDRTPEEDYAAKVAREYGEFIPTRPWFEFPFDQKAAGLWSSTEFFGPNFLRKCERKFFLTLEYTAKWAYAAVIRLASHSVYGIADTEIYATVAKLPESAFQDARVRRIKVLPNGAWVVAIPHYQGFTDTVPDLARQGVEFIEVAGNDEILATIIAPAGWHYDFPEGKPLFEMALLNTTDSKRVAIQVPVRVLATVLREVQDSGMKVEHLFDY